MRRGWVSVLVVFWLSGGAEAKSPRSVLRALNSANFRGNALLSSTPNYRVLSRYRYREQKPTSVEGASLWSGRDRLSAGHENAQFESEGAYGLHQLLIGRKGRKILLAVVDGLWGNSYLGGFVAERAATRLLDTFTRRSLREALLGLPEQLEVAVDRQVRGYKESPYPGDYDAAMPIAEDAGAFITAAEISQGMLQVEHIGNARLLLIRDGEVFWQTQDHNRGYRMSSNPEAVINPADEGGTNIFRAIELPASMGAPIAELIDSSTVKLRPGDRIILASDSVWATCTNTDLLCWTSGRGNADANRHARDNISQRIAALNELDGTETYDERFALIVYDYGQVR